MRSGRGTVLAAPPPTPNPSPPRKCVGGGEERATELWGSSSPLPPRSGGEGLGVGGASTDTVLVVFDRNASTGTVLAKRTKSVEGRMDFPTRHASCADLLPQAGEVK